MNQFIAWTNMHIGFPDGNRIIFVVFLLLSHTIIEFSPIDSRQQHGSTHHHDMKNGI